MNKGMFAFVAIALTAAAFALGTKAPVHADADAAARSDRAGPSMVELQSASTKALPVQVVEDMI